MDIRKRRQYRAITTSFVSWMLIASVAIADQVMLVIDSVPDHGLVARRVDITAAAHRCRVRNVIPSQIAAADQQGNPVPFQFIAEPGFDQEKNISGLIVARLAPNRASFLRLEFDAESPGTSTELHSIETPHYAAVHDATKGGLPTEIRFPATGKVFGEFRWQDRVYHEKLGSFTLQNDKSVSVECIAIGPLGTVIRVRAKYLDATGKSPASNPEAIYDWVYLNELPLALVTAKITQAEAFRWNELHFLELNFPGQDFKRWAGGEPLSEGNFQATGKSHHAGKWGALVEGLNVIAMFDCGRLIFHDGRGGYGTYLHAHGDQAWKPWSGTQAQFSGWLWIGSSSDAIENVRRFVNQSPATANIVVTTADVRATIELAEKQHRQNWRNTIARQLEAAGRLEQAIDVAQGRLLPNWILVEAGDLKLVLEKADQGIRMLSLLDATTTQELLAANIPALFSITVRDAQTGELLTVTSDSGWRQLETSEANTVEGRKLAFASPIDDRLKGMWVKVTLDANDADNALEWDLQIINDSSQWGLWRVLFPQVSVKHLGAGAKVFLPHTAGIESWDIWNTAQRRGGTYPSGWTCMQYMAAYNEAARTGLYVGMHDPFGSTKDILAVGLPDQRAVAFRFEHPVPNMGKPGTGFDLPGGAKWQLLRGDWFDAATIYRNWVRREAKWWPTLGPNGRTDTPDWMRQLPAWAMTGGPASSCVPQLKAFVKELGMPVGFHWYNWHQIPFDNDYPHYFPPKDGFAEGVAELKRAGVYVMPYINGRLWDTRDKGAEDRQFTHLALPAATKDEEGNAYTESYGSKETDGSNVRLAAMCPYTSLWQSRVTNIVLRLLNEYGLNGVYIDQVAAAQPRLCFDASHGHALGGGHWWTDGYWRMLDTIRAAKPANSMLTTECNAEPYIKWFDGYLTWHWQEQDMVPAFSAVYGGAIQMFGRAYRGGPSQDLANRMKAGQQLVFGEQIGWFGPNIIKRPDCGEFLRDCIKLRWLLNEYFYAGRMVRPPKLTGKVPTVTADWQWRGEWPITTDAVMTGAWQLRSQDKVVLLFANVSDKSLATHLQFNTAQYGLAGKPLKVVTITPTGPQDRFNVKTGAEPELKLTARTVLAWEMTPLAPD